MPNRGASTCDASGFQQRDGEYSHAPPGNQRNRFAHPWRIEGSGEGHG
jgi:hypothetical protein